MPPIEEADDIRSTISSAIESAETGSEGGSTPSADVGGTPQAAPTSPGVATPAIGVAGAVATPVGSIPPVEGTPATPGFKAPPADDKQNIETVVAEKAPGTWTPQARERWNETHPVVRAEIVRRERETSRALTQSTEARQFKKTFDAAIRPFEGFIAAEKSDPIKATVNMMQTAALLRTGTPTQKAQLVAQVIGQYGIDLQMLDGLLAGQQPTGPASAQEFIQREIQRHTSPLLEQLKQRDREFEQAIEADVDQDLAAFAADPKNEFYNDVREIMADMLEVDMKRGGNMGLTEAYQRATLLSEPVRLTLEGRKTGQSAQRGHQIAQQARSGAISVKPSDETGVTGIPPPGDSIRDAINFALQKTSGR